MTSLISETFFKDPRVLKAKELILEALRENQNKIKSIKNPEADFIAPYKKDLEDFAKLRGGNLYYPYIGSGIGKGPYVELTDGSIKLDFITGIGVHYWGHSHEDLISTSIDAAISDTIMQGNLQQNNDSKDLMGLMLSSATKNGANLDHCFLSTSGAQANENALKIIFQKNEPAYRILCFEKCFSGRTLALAQMTDKAAYRMGLPKALEVDYIPFYDENDPKGSTQAAVSRLKRHIDRFPKMYAGMCFELIQGEGGYTPGNTDFFLEIIKILKENNIAVWFDEVQTVGRTSEIFAFQHFKLDEFIDILTLGKMTQVCATIYSKEYKPKPGLISQTFTSSSMAIKASLKIFTEMKSGNLFGPKGQIFKYHNHFTDHFKRLSTKYPGQFLGSYGLGGMIAFTVFDGDLNKSKEFANKLFQNGLISFIAGKDPVRIRFLLPMAAIKIQDIDLAAKIIEETYIELQESAK